MIVNKYSYVKYSYDQPSMNVVNRRVAVTPDVKRQQAYSSDGRIAVIGV